MDSHLPEHALTCPRLQPPHLWPSVPGSPTRLRLRRLPPPIASQSRLTSSCSPCHVSCPREVHEAPSSTAPPSSLSPPQQEVPSVPAPRAPEPHPSSLPATRAQGSPLACIPSRPPWPRAQALPPRYCSLQTDALRTSPRSAASGSRQERSASGRPKARVSAVADPWLPKLPASAPESSEPAGPGVRIPDADCRLDG